MARQGSGAEEKHKCWPCSIKNLGAGTVIDFIQKQLDASERLFNMMAEDHKVRTKNLQMWIEMNESFQKKLDQRDAEIAVLRAKLSQYEVVERV